MNEHRDKILRLPPNRVWRTYSGGLLLDRVEGRAAPLDSRFPQDWLGSTMRSINPVYERENEGLSRVIVNGREVLLADLIAADPEYLLGARHLSAFGANQWCW